MDYFDRILETIATYEMIGVRVLQDGAKLTGHVPHVAPLAWFHQVFPPLTLGEIQRIEANIEIAIPDVFSAFLQKANGLYIFSGDLYIRGLRRNYSRSIEAVWQPFSILTPNVDERPRNAKKTHLFIGGYEPDGSQLYIDVSDQSVYRCTQRSVKPLYKWPSFEVMLESEVQRLTTLFDHQGRLLNPKLPTTP